MDNAMHMNSYISEYTPKDYADSVPEGSLLVDCSFGVNGTPIDSDILSVLHELAEDGSTVKYYPHSHSLTDQLCHWYLSHGIGNGWLTSEHFLPGTGSFGILSSINQLFLGKGRRVLGHSPQFMAYVDNVRYTGAEYASYVLSKETGYMFLASEYLSLMKESYDLFIVENPINPTGQVISLADLEMLAKKAVSLGRVLVVDEAYGDYMLPSQSAINLIHSCSNVIVTRTFSKGFGMAGMRLGYAVASPASGILQQLEKIALPFQANSIARELACAAMRCKESETDPFGMEENRTAKTILHKIFENSPIHIAKTCDSVPIQLLYTNSEEIPDLQLYLMNFGILSVGCAHTDGLNAKAVRIMLPAPDRFPLLCELLQKAVKASLPRS